MESAPLIQLDKITKSFMQGLTRQFILRNVMLNVERGEFLTVMGPSGAGKSTLAVAVARQLQSGTGPDHLLDVALAELAPVRDTAGVTRAVAEAAGVQGRGSVETAALAANLNARTLLLVLDNCEHLLDASAGLVDAILDAGTQARILVTSREPLRVRGRSCAERRRAFHAIHPAIRLVERTTPRLPLTPRIPER